MKGIQHTLYEQSYCGINDEIYHRDGGVIVKAATQIYIMSALRIFTTKNIR